MDQPWLKRMRSEAAETQVMNQRRGSSRNLLRAAMMLQSVEQAAAATRWLQQHEEEKKTFKSSRNFSTLSRISAKKNQEGETSPRVSAVQNETVKPFRVTHTGSQRIQLGRFLPSEQQLLAAGRRLGEIRIIQILHHLQQLTVRNTRPPGKTAERLQFTTLTCRGSKRD